MGNVYTLTLLYIPINICIYKTTAYIANILHTYTPTWLHTHTHAHSGTPIRRNIYGRNASDLLRPTRRTRGCCASLVHCGRAKWKRILLVNSNCREVFAPLHINAETTPNKGVVRCKPLYNVASATANTLNWPQPNLHLPPPQRSSATCSDNLW